jgi:hypothetical protein
MKTRNIFIAAFAAALVTGSVACRKDAEEPAPPTTAGSGHLLVSFTLMNGTDTFHLSDLLHDGAGRLIRFDTVRFFISGIHLHNDADVIIAEYPALHELFDGAQPNAQFDLGDLEAQHVHSFAFDVGVDEEANHADPATAAPPLNDLSMYVDPSTGYKFVLLSGHVDSNDDGAVDGSDATFRYVIDTDALLDEDEVHVHHDLAEGEHYVIQAWADMAVVLSGVDVMNDPMTMTVDNLPLATQIRDSLVSSLGPDPDE